MIKYQKNFDSELSIGNDIERKNEAGWLYLNSKTSFEVKVQK